MFLTTWKAFNRELRDATHVKDVLSLLAQGTWCKRHGRIKTCPDDCIPSAHALAEWLPDCPRPAWTDTWKRCAPLLQDSEIEPVGQVPYLLQPARLAAVEQSEDIYALPHFDSQGRKCSLPWSDPMLMQSVIREDVEKLHGQWVQEGGKHPLGALVKAWQERPRKVRPDTERETGIVPETLRVSSDRRETGELTAWPEGIGSWAVPEDSGWLPGLEPPPSRIVPAMPLVIFDATGRPSTSRGRGASIALRLAIELLMAVPREDRSGPVEVEFTLGDLVSWLWPGKRKAKPNEFWPKIRTARHELHNAAIPISDVEYWIPFASRRFPRTPRDRSARFTFELKLPPGSEIGPRVHRPTLRLYGLQSAPKYRAWLGLSYLWHKHLRYTLSAKGGGTRTLLHPPRLPAVSRDKRTGGILDIHGRPVTHKGGKPVKSPLHPAAVPILDPNGKPRTEHNAAMDRLPEFGPDELIELTQPNAKAQSRSLRRRHLQIARQTLNAMAKAGNIAIDKDRNGGWRILPPIDILDRFRR